MITVVVIKLVAGQLVEEWHYVTQEELEELLWALARGEVLDVLCMA